MLTRQIGSLLATLASSQDQHKWPLTCGNVELRRFELLTSCMPCPGVPSRCVALGRVTAGQVGCDVWLCPAASGVVWPRSHLVSHWLSGRSVNTGRCRGRTTEKWRWSKVAIVSASRRSATAITDASTKPNGKSP